MTITTILNEVKQNLFFINEKFCKENLGRRYRNKKKEPNRNSRNEKCNFEIKNSLVALKIQMNT